MRDFLYCVPPKLPSTRLNPVLSNALVSDIWDEQANSLAAISIVHDILVSWNCHLYQYTIGRNGGQLYRSWQNGLLMKSKLNVPMVEREVPEKSRDLTLGIDLGGSKILAAVVNSQGKVLSSHESATPSTKGCEAIIQSILDSAHRALRQAAVPSSELCAVGIGAAGISNPETGILFSSPNLAGCHNVPLRDIMQERLDKKTFLLNDANAAALGELYFGAARGALNFMYITLSTGIGGGIVINGKIYSGAIGTAGEIGHMTIDYNGRACNCGSRGCWETLASGTAMAREAKHRIKEGAGTSILDYTEGDVQKVTAEAIHSAARQGDSLAKELIAQTAYYVGVGLANLINIFNPELIVIGGGLSSIGDMLLEPAFKVAGERAYRQAFQAVRFASAELGRNAGVLGAAAFALREARELGGSEKHFLP
jgi:glucokinase